MDGDITETINLTPGDARRLRALYPESSEYNTLGFALAKIDAAARGHEDGAVDLTGDELCALLTAHAPDPATASPSLVNAYAAVDRAWRTYCAQALIAQKTARLATLDALEDQR